MLASASILGAEDKQALLKTISKIKQQNSEACSLQKQIYQSIIHYKNILQVQKKNLTNEIFYHTRRFAASKDNSKGKYEKKYYTRDERDYGYALDDWKRGEPSNSLIVSSTDRTVKLKALNIVQAFSLGAFDLLPIRSELLQHKLASIQKSDLEWATKSPIVDKNLLTPPQIKLLFDDFLIEIKNKKTYEVMRNYDLISEVVQLVLRTLVAKNEPALDASAKEWKDDIKVVKELCKLMELQFSDKGKTIQVKNKDGGFIIYNGPPVAVEVQDVK